MAIAPPPTFPDDYPDSCPPGEATDADGEYYRLMKKNPPEEADFHSLRELGLKRRGDACQQRGLSIFADSQEAAETYRFFAKKHGVAGTGIGSLVGKLKLQPPDGKVKPTPRNGNSHHTWWPYQETNRLACFVQITEDAKDELET